ncbi:hypothetical protein LTR08_008507 [Meristemomyces frigidus]|nr:hypothetical protein LTR08_008507 [Meristemomyces frigidus]
MADKNEAETTSATDSASTTATTIAGVTYNPGTTPSSDVTESSAASTDTGTLTSTPLASSKGNSNVGVGVGVGLGLPILFGILAALFFFLRRRKSRSAGPYGPVMLGEKGVSDDSSYGGPRAEPHEMQHLHPTAPTVPFLRPISTRDTPSREPEHEQSPHQIVGSLKRKPAPQLKPTFGVLSRPAKTWNVSRPSTPPLVVQLHPGTASQSPDEPPSPVSPISAADSRPASLRRSDAHD